MKRYLVLGIEFVLVMVAGIAVAQAGAGDVIYVCASEKDGALRLVESDADCLKKDSSCV